MTYMVLYMHSFILILKFLLHYIEEKKNNLFLRVKTIHFLIYDMYETKEHRKHILFALGRVLDQAVPI